MFGILLILKIPLEEQVATTLYHHHAMKAKWRVIDRRCSMGLEVANHSYRTDPI